MQATLDLNRTPLQQGDALPPLWHWLYFWTIQARSGLGPDGHPALGGFLPPVGRARRMWAGSRVRFLQPLRIGEPAQQISTVVDVTVKQGGSGRLVFVTVEHEISGADGLCIVDQHDIVYRERTPQPKPQDRGKAAPTDARYSMPFQTDSNLLFRYSALTFNGHRIHYDREYARDAEGYPDLVVHGPLLATLMVDLASNAWPQRNISAFRFRGHRPVFDARPFRVCAKPGNGDSMELWVADSDGMLCMQGNADFSTAP